MTDQMVSKILVTFGLLTLLALSIITFISNNGQWTIDSKTKELIKRDTSTIIVEDIERLHNDIEASNTVGGGDWK